MKRHSIKILSSFFRTGGAGGRGEAPPPAGGHSPSCLHACNTNKMYRMSKINSSWTQLFLFI